MEFKVGDRVRIDKDNERYQQMRCSGKYGIEAQCWRCLYFHKNVDKSIFTIRSIKHYVIKIEEKYACSNDRDVHSSLEAHVCSNIFKKAYNWIKMKG